MRLVQGIYANARSRVRVAEGFSKEFEVKVGSIRDPYSPLLFIIVLEALSREFSAGVPWEDLYADDLLPKGMCQEALDMERSHGEGGEGKCRRDKGHDLWYRPGPLAEFRRKPMQCMLHRSSQQQHLLQWLQTLGAQEKQRATTADNGVHGKCPLY